MRTHLRDRTLGVTCPTSRLVGAYSNPAQTIILKCERKLRHIRQGPASEKLSPVLCSMAFHRSSASLVACCADPCGCPVDRPTDHRGAHGAPLAGLDSPHAISRTIRIRSAKPHLDRFPTRRHRRGRRALLSASWIRLAGDPNRSGR